MLTQERASAGECAAAWFQARVPKVPRMNHVRPNLQSNGNISSTSRGRETRGVIEQRLGRPNLNEGGREPSQVGKKRRYPRIFPVHAGGQIGISKLVQVGFVNERIYGVLSCER